MRKSYKKIIIGILIIVGLFLFYISDLSKETKIVIAVGAFFLYLLYYLDKEIIGIKNILRLHEHLSQKEEPIKPISHKIKYYVDIKWIEIIKHCFPDIRTDDEAWDFVERLYEDKSLEINKKNSLFQQGFSFVIFSDEISGLYQIWSDHYKTFLDELEIMGDIFDVGLLTLYRKFPNNKIGTQFRIRPDYIGFRSNLPDGKLTEEDKINQIPLSDVINLFRTIYKNTGLFPMAYCVKTFPKELRDKFDKYNVKYDTFEYEDYFVGADFKDELIEDEWLKNNNIELYNQEMRNHIFSAPYYSVSINMEIF